MLKRPYKAQESLVCYWATQAVALCADIDDETLLEHVTPVQQAIERLGRDRRIIVVGGKSCGKSSLLAGIAGYPPIAAVPIQGTYTRWRYRCKDGEAAQSLFMPLAELEGLELVDTVDCSQDRETIDTLMKEADVIIGVVDARSPESSPCWEMLSGMDGVAERLLFAVTFVDTLSAEEELKLKETLREFCRVRFHTPPPLCSVTPNTAVSESFSERVQEMLEASGGIRTNIRAVIRASVDLVYKQGSILSTREAVARTDSGFLASIENEIDDLLSHQMKGLERRVHTLCSATQRALPRLLRRFNWTFGYLFSPVTLLRLELFGAGSEKFYYRTLSHDVLHMQEESDRQFLISCSTHWKGVRPRMKKTLECEIGDFPAEILERELAQLRDRLGRDLHHPFAQGRMRLHLADIFNQRSGWMMACLILICLSLTIGGAFGFIGQDSLATYGLAGALILWLGASLGHLVAARRIRQEVVQITRDMQIPLEQALSAAVKNLIVSRVSAYRSLYTAPRRKVSEHESSLEPLQKRHREINRQLHAAAPRL